MWAQTQKEVHYKTYDYTINDVVLISVEVWKPASMGTYIGPWEVNVDGWGEEYDITIHGRYNKNKILSQVLDVAENEKEPKLHVFENIFK